jgi:hypothetical protein
VQVEGLPQKFKSGSMDGAFGSAFACLDFVSFKGMGLATIGRVAMYHKVFDSE